MKNIITKIKIILERIKNQLDEAEDQISNLEDKVAENTLSSKKEKELEKAKRKRKKKKEGSLRILWDKIKHNNIHIIGVQKEKKESKELKTYLKK